MPLNFSLFFFVIPVKYPLGITGKPFKCFLSQVFAVCRSPWPWASREWGSRFALVPPQLVQALILVKPVAQGFTLHITLLLDGVQWRCSRLQQNKRHIINAIWWSCWQLKVFIFWLGLGNEFKFWNKPQLQSSGPLLSANILHKEPEEFVGLAYQGKDIVFRFIIEYSSLRDFGPLGNNRSIFIWGFLKDEILLVLKFEISYRVMMSWRILVPLEDFLEDYIFAWWNIWISTSSFALRYFLM